MDTTNSYYSKLDSQFLQYSQDNSAEVQEKTKVELLDIPPARKISDCSTSSLSGDESDIAELQQVKPSRVSATLTFIRLLLVPKSWKAGRSDPRLIIERLRVFSFKQTCLLIQTAGAILSGRYRKKGRTKRGE